MINHSIIKNVYSIPGAVSVEFRNVPQRHCFTMLLSILYFWLGTQKSSTNLNNLFFMNIKFNELFREIGAFKIKYYGS